MTYVKLNLSCPAALSEQVVEYLLDSALLKGGFTTVATHGHGRDFTTASLREKVRGRVQALTIMAILPSEGVAPLLAALRERFRNPHMIYWTELVEEFGDFA